MENGNQTPGMWSVWVQSSYSSDLIFYHALCLHSHTADCGIPMIENSAEMTYNSTLEGSVIVVYCGESEFMAECLKIGKWSPDPTENILCTPTQPSESGMILYNIMH